MSKNKCKKNRSNSRTPHAKTFPLTLRYLKKGELARFIFECPDGVQELGNLDGIVGIVVSKSDDLPNNANEFLLEINLRTPTVMIAMDYFLNELSQKHGARIFLVMTGTAFFIVTDLSWNEATELLQQSMSKFGLWPFN